MSNIHRKHLRHNAVERMRHSNMSAFLTAQSQAKAVPENIIRDLFRNIPGGMAGKTAQDIEAVATAALAGASIATITATLAQKAVVTPTDLSFGLYVPARETRSLLLGATSGAITVDFDATANTITRGSGSFVTDGFQVGSILNLSGCADAGNNTSHPVVTQVTALVLTCDDIAADESADAGVTITTLNTITDADAVDFPTMVNGDSFTLSGTDLNEGTDFVVDSQTGPVIILDISGENPELVVEIETTANISINAGTVNYGRKYNLRDVVDEVATFDRYAGTVVLAEGDWENEGFVVGGKVKVDNAGSAFNCETTTVRAVSGATLTVARVSTGSITVTFAAGAKGTATRGTGSFVTDGFVPGMEVAISGGAADAANRSIFTVLGVSALVLTLADLPASETNDAGVTITSVDFRKSGDASDARFTQYNTIDGIDTTNIAVGDNLKGQTGDVDADPDTAKEFYVVVTAKDTDLLFCELPEDAQYLDELAPYNLGFPFVGVEDRDPNVWKWVFVSNRIERAAGDFENDGFAAGEPIDIAGAAEGNVDGRYTLLSTANTIAKVTGWFYQQYLRDTDATITGYARLTRAAGSFADDGFALGKKFELLGTLGDAVVTSGSSTVTFAAATKTATRGSGSFIEDGFQVGPCKITGAADAGNNGVHYITKVAALVLTFGDTIADETDDAGVTIVQDCPNDRAYRVAKVVSATEVEMDTTIVAEATTALVKAMLVTEKAR